MSRANYFQDVVIIAIFPQNEKVKLYLLGLLKFLRSPRGTGCSPGWNNIQGPST